MLKRRFFLVAIAAAVVGACSESTAPTSAPVTVGPEASQQKLLGGLLGTLTKTVSNLLVAPVERSRPLAEDVTWSFVAGPLGAVSSNPGVGLTVVVPPGALSSTKTITVTALEGSAVAYKFEPHGLVFDRKVMLTQDLRLTSGGGLLGGLLGLGYRGAYFSTDRLQTTSEGLAVVTELLPALSSSLTRTVSFGVEHFSGYIVASGRGGDIDAF